MARCRPSTPAGQRRGEGRPGRKRAAPCRLLHSTLSRHSAVCTCCLTADVEAGRARGYPAAAHAMAVGAARRLPCAARARAGAQNSFRSPSVRCIRPAAPSQFTKCAARTGPIAALLSAIAQGPACPWALGRHSDVRRDVLGPASQIAAAGYPLALCVAWCSFAARERRLTPAAGGCCSEVKEPSAGGRGRGTEPGLKQS